MDITEQNEPAPRGEGALSQMYERHDMWGVLKEERHLESMHDSPTPFLTDSGGFPIHNSNDDHGCECWSPADLRSPAPVL